jgi:hypothetical protein
MKSPNCIQSICRDYRRLFASDQAMAGALGVDVRIVRDLLAGTAYPNLEIMVEIQAALRKVSGGRPVLNQRGSRA